LLGFGFHLHSAQCFRFLSCVAVFAAIDFSRSEC
jgi:hypothetical protein